MLVLARKPGECILIDGPGPTTIMVLSCTPSRVRLGFEAPPETVIVRTEFEESPPELLPELAEV